MIDCALCYSIIMLIIQWAILSHLRGSMGITNEWFENSWNMELYVLLTISLPVWLYFIYFDSNRSKGMVGKRIMKLAVLNMENQRIGPGRSFQRTFLKLSPWEIAHIGIIFPTPIYFADEPGIRLLTIAGILLFVSFMFSILLDAEGRAIYNRITGVKEIGILRANH